MTKASQLLLVFIGLSAFIPSLISYFFLEHHVTLPNHEINVMDMSILVVFTVVIPLLLYVKIKKLRAHLKDCICQFFSL